MKKLLLLLLILMIACSDSKEFEPEVLEYEEPDVVEIKKTNEKVDFESQYKEELKEFCEKKFNVKVIYNVRNVVDGKAESVKQSVVFKGEDYKQSTDLDSLYVIDKELYACEFIDGEWSCYHLPQETSPGPDCAVPDEISVKKVGEKSFVETQSSCYELTSDEYTGKDLHCFTEEGVLVYSKSERKVLINYESGEDEEVDNVVERTATYITYTIGDNEFILPAEATEMPNP